MFGEKKDERWNRVIMLYFLIWLLFIENSAVAFWQFVGLHHSGHVTGTIYYNDGVTPLPISLPQEGSFIELMNTTTNSRIAYFTADDFGRYTSPQVPEGNYYLKVMLVDTIIGVSTEFDINASQVTPVDIKVWATTVN